MSFHLVELPELQRAAAGGAATSFRLVEPPELQLGQVLELIGITGASSTGRRAYYFRTQQAGREVVIVVHLDIRYAYEPVPQPGAGGAGDARLGPPDAAGPRPP